jgi:hypothetical protein
MRRRLIISLICGVVLLALFVDGSSVRACGDKLLVLGRGVRFESDIPIQPASILLFLHKGSPSFVVLNDPRLQSILREAGHKLQSAGTLQELEEALKAGKYDIVMADFSDASSLESVVGSAPSKPVLVPFIFKGTKTAKADAALAEKRYRCVLSAPNRVGHYLATVDKAMELRSKRDGLKPALVANK